MPTLRRYAAFGVLADRSALPSLVQVTTAPVSATMKLPPVRPASAVRMRGRVVHRAGYPRDNADRRWPASVPMRAREDTSATSERSLWTEGTTTWLGASLSSCWMRSPRSVSVISMPCSLRILAHPAFFRQHRLRLDQRLGVVRRAGCRARSRCARQTILGPVHRHAVLRSPPPRTARGRYRGW